MKAILLTTSAIILLAANPFSKKQIFINENSPMAIQTLGCINALEVFNNASNAQCIVRWITIIDDNGPTNIYTGTVVGATTWVGCVGRTSNLIIAQILMSFNRAYIVDCNGTRISNIVTYDPSFGNYTFTLTQEGCGIPGSGINTLVVE